MQELQITIKHTDVEESILLVNAGLDPETADMMIEQFEGKEPKYLFGFYKRTFEYYPQYYKPCWSADRLRAIVDELKVQTMSHGGAGQIPDEKLVPVVMCGITMKIQQEYLKSQG